MKTTIFPGRYVQGENALKRLGDELARFGKKAFIIADPFAAENILNKFLDQIKDKIGVDMEVFNSECSDEEIERLSEIVHKHGNDIICGVGGGKALDTAKAVAHTAGTPVAVVPTIASTDAPCSALSVIYTQEGEFKRYLVLPKNPDIVLVDTRVVADAPVRFLVSGIGDALATYFEAESARAKYAPNMTGDIGSMTAYALAELCYDTLLDYGEAAVIAASSKTVTPALEKIVEANTLLSGLGFESGGLAAAHAIHNGLTVLEPTHDYYHGEKVAFGTLASLILTDKDPEIIEEVFSFCNTVGLPITLEEIGLGNVSDADLMRAAEAASVEGETIHNEPVPVTAESVFNAMKAADAIGRTMRY